MHTVAALVSGLREGSRLRVKYGDQKANRTDVLLAVIADRRDELLVVLAGTDKRTSLAAELLSYHPEKKSNVMTFNSVDDFYKYRYGGGETWQIQH